MITFGPFRLFPDRQLLLKDERPVRIGSRALDLLKVLLENHGEVVSKDQLIARVWPQQFVEEGNLKVNVANLRKILGDGQPGQRYIVNVSGRGYSFVGPISRQGQQNSVTSQAGTPAKTPDTSPRHRRILGREAAIEQISDKLLTSKFITIVGSGGIGKTTVAKAVCDRLRPAMRNGVQFVDLSPLDDPLLVSSTLAAALDLAVRSDSAIRNIVSFLKEKQMLVVLDNCEHVIDAATLLAEEIVKGAPETYVLATSREPLRADGEHVYRLPVLESPTISADLTAADALRFPAVQLFVERAAAALSGFELRDGDAATVAQACLRLDGLPLAIELTASRIDAFGIAGLASLLEDRLRLPQGRRTAQPRHQTLGATLDWSYALLSESERVTLGRSSVFAGVFSMQSARAVIGAANQSATMIEGDVANLVSKSLLTPLVDQSAPRYRLLDTTRAYARERLAESAEGDELARRHAQHFEDLLRQSTMDWESKPATLWIESHRGLIDDVRNALDWAFSSAGGGALGVALTIAALPLWFQMALISECQERVERALSGPPEDRGPDADMRLHAALGWSLMQTRGSVTRTRDSWTRVLEFARTLGDVDYQLRALWGLWAGLLNRSELRQALALAEQFYNLADQHGQVSDRFVGDRMIGYIQHLLGHQDLARFHIERMLEHYQTPVIGAQIIRYVFDQRVTARCFLARIMWLQGFADQAKRLADDIVDEALASKDTLSLCQALVQAACPISVFIGRLDRLQFYVSLLLQHATRNALDFWQTWGQCFEGLLLIKSGKGDAGLEELRQALAELKTIEYGVYYITFLGEFAVAQSRAGKIDQGLVTIDDALRRSERNEERWYIAELLRIKGEILMQQATRETILSAEQHFLKSLDSSRSDRMPAWQLRTAISLYRLWSTSGRADEARALLSATMEQFTEGFSSADYIQASHLLRTPDFCI